MEEPTHRDLVYGPHERNVFDLYRVKSSAPAPLYVFVHGGGFMGGDKSAIPQELLGACLEAGIAVAAVNYRLSGTDLYPAAMLDCTRAIQFLRHRRREFGIDPGRLAAGGGSAGAGISFWIGFRPDMADPGSDDPVARESTRLGCIGSWQAQSSYDPNFIRTIISGSAYRHEALQQFFGVAPDEFESPRARKMFEEASAINYVSGNAPPVFLWYLTPDRPMTPELSADEGIHHPIFGRILKEKLDEVGVECVVRTREELPDCAEDEVRATFCRELVGFVKRHIG